MKTLRYFLKYLIIALVICFVYTIIDPTSIIQETYMIHIPRYIIYAIWTVISCIYLYLFVDNLPQANDKPERKETQISQTATESEIEQLRKENESLKQRLKDLDDDSNTK
ncbi:hypothetical protein [Companilactobacillus insicii]|uniref:hypothetical protein n=1 Tax=Companilactobacillus insicii TaxID=1732567 RepID=UPI000F78D679|nr:hypothetical protein [Companilactobacillus insicii]